ncbi:hypothetical protein [Candidatus Accumulibacter contiguus]|jgi:hypothetical protein|uniref:hypothetical protein n=1 Tax=Candidatus Accumulibacter contiguus TaxID=2954381 RepID=UPI002FC36072
MPMLVRLVIRSFLLIATVLAFGYATADQASNSNEACQIPEGRIRATVTGSEEYWVYEWYGRLVNLVQNNKQPLSVLGTAPEGAVYGGKWNLQKSSNPQEIMGRESRLDTPFAVSADGGWLVAAIYPPSGQLSLSPSRKVALIERKTSRVARVVDAQREIMSLAWAPSGKYFAALVSRNVTDSKLKTPKDWFAKGIGHPIPYYSLGIAIFGLDGRLICEQHLKQKLAYGQGYLSWITGAP